jgi:uncharacterized protein YjbI with pentapeptide repeats
MDRINLFWKVFGILVAIVIAATVAYQELPLMVSYSLWGQDSFYAGLITNMYNSVIDFFIFSIVLLALLNGYERRDKIQLYKDNIDDCRFWYSEEAAFKNAGNVRRLQVLNILSVDLSKTSLINTKLKRIKLKDTPLMGSDLTASSFDESTFDQCNFRGAQALKASFNNVRINRCNFKYLKFQEAQMVSSEIVDSEFDKANLTNARFRATIFKNCTFFDAILDGCDFERADLRGARGLTVAQLLTCANIKYAKLDSQLKTKIDAVNPKLLNK